MELLHRNLEALRRSNPELAHAIDACRPGPSCVVIETHESFTVQLDGRLEASEEDPLGEGERMARYLIGRAEESGAKRLAIFGLGVHTLPFLSSFDGQILVIEPSLDLCRTVFERVDLVAVLARVELVCASEPAPVLRRPAFREGERGLFLNHVAARRRSPRLHDELAARFHPGGVASPLHVAVIPPLYGGSLPVAKSCARAFRELGHYVSEPDLTAFWPAYEAIQKTTEDPRLAGVSQSLRSAFVRLVGETLIASFQLEKPDLVFALAQAPLDPEVLQRMGDMGIVRAFWFCEDFRVMDYWKAYTGVYDTIFHVQPDDFSEPLSQAGGSGVPLPMAFDPSVTRPVRLTEEERQRYDCDVSFVGAGYHNRRLFLPSLCDLGLRIYGVEWPEYPPFGAAMPEPNARQSTETSNLIFNASRINVNLHSSPWCDGVNPVGDYLNPRTFELAGAGGFQLVDERRDLARAFTPGTEVETYADVTECRRKIDYYLEHPDERREIAAAGHRRALSEHTYRHRMEAVIDALRAGPVPLAPRRSDVPTAAAVLDAARNEPGLSEIIGRLDPETVIDSDAITVAIAQGDGELSRDEKILIYMREVLGEVRFLNEIGGGV